MAAGDIRIVVTERGYDELRAKVRGHDALFGPAYRTWAQNVGRVGVAGVQAGAPIGSTGKTVNMVSAKVSRAKIPRSIRIVEAATSPNRFPYPRLLEFSPFAQNRYKKGTNRHRLWMKNAITRVTPIFDAQFQQAADGVVKEWLS